MSEEKKNKNVDKNNQHRNSENSEQNNDNEENKEENNDNRSDSDEYKELEDNEETEQSNKRESALDNISYQREVSFLEPTSSSSFASLTSWDSNLIGSGHTESITYGEECMESTEKLLYPVLKEEIFSVDDDITLYPVKYTAAERQITETTMIIHNAIARQYGSYGKRERDSTKIYGTDSVLFTALRGEGHFLYFILPPDGGTGWIVTMISFLCQLLVSGVLYAIGPLLPHISADLGLSDVKVTFIPTSQIGKLLVCFFYAYHSQLPSSIAMVFIV